MSTCCCSVAQSCLTLCDPMTAAHQVPLFMGFSRQECWSGLPFSPPGDLPSPGIKPMSPALQADSLPSEPRAKPGERGYPLLRVKVKVAQSCPTLCYPMDSPWNSPGQNTGVDSLSLLQGFFPTQVSNPGILHCRRIESVDVVLRYVLMGKN